MSSSSTLLSRPWSSDSSLQITSNVTVSTPELLWHGGGNENGKPDPVYSVDLHPLNVLATAGIDANVPPKGSVRVSVLNVIFHPKISLKILHSINVLSSCGPSALTRLVKPF